jgi:hypothetical protein
MPLEPITHERPRIPREQCPSGEEEQEPKDAKYSMPNDQLLIWLEWNGTGACRACGTAIAAIAPRTDLLSQIE